MVPEISQDARTISRATGLPLSTVQAAVMRDADDASMEELEAASEILEKLRDAFEGMKQERDEGDANLIRLQEKARALANASVALVTAIMEAHVGPDLPDHLEEMSAVSDSLKGLEDIY